MPIAVHAITTVIFKESNNWVSHCLAANNISRFICTVGLRTKFILSSSVMTLLYWNCCNCCYLIRMNTERLRQKTVERRERDFMKLVLNSSSALSQMLVTNSCSLLDKSYVPRTSECRIHCYMTVERSGIHKEIKLRFLKCRCRGDNNTSYWGPIQCNYVTLQIWLTRTAPALCHLTLYLHNLF